MPPSSVRADREAFAAEFGRIRRLEAADPAGSLAAYRSLADRGPGFAELHFRMGRLLERRGATAEAIREYGRSRDLDAMPQRCRSSFQEAVRRAAAGHPKAIVIDGQAAIGAVAPGGLLNDRIFHDAHHPTLRGYVALAQEVLDALQARRAFGWPEGVPSPRIDPDECAVHFGIGRREWARVCGKSAEWYQINAFSRYDPEPRLDRARRYIAAYGELARGIGGGLADRLIREWIDPGRGE